MTPSEINSMLTERAFEVARMLLPNGKLDGREWRVADVGGGTGKSMGVCTSGSKAGVWSDFDTGEAGDLLDLWVATKNIGIAQAIKEAKSFLGVTDPFYSKVPKKKYTRPPKPKCGAVKGSVRDWLINERKLTPDTLQKFKIAAQGGNVILPFLRDDELVMCKWRSITEKKTGVTGKDQEPCLFGWQALNIETRWVAITEGEFDAMALDQYGIPALSVPFGGGAGAKQQWVETEWENLDRFETIYLCMDSDNAGRAAAKELLDRLGAERCRIVTLPAKDANDCLREGVPREMIHQCIANAVAIDPEELKPADQFQDSVYAEFYPEEYEDEPHFVGPWPKTHQNIMFRMSELSLIAGINGHGKSQLVGHLLLEAMRQGFKCCVASLELHPGRLLGRLTAQACGLVDGRPSKNYIDAVMNWYSEKLWLFNLVGTAKQDRLLEVFAYAVKRYQIKVFVIDSLLKCGLGEDDYTGQKLFVERLCDFKEKHGVHIILVCHMRKGESEMKMPGKFDLRGAGAITDLADSMFVHFRNKRKEKKMEKPDEETDMEEMHNMPDAFFICEKQRNGRWEGTTGLWFCRNSNQFLSGPDQKPFQYVQYSQQSRLTA